MFLSLLKKIIFVVVLAIITTNLYPKSREYKWQRISGLWTIENSLSYETQGGTRIWNYYDLLDYNSILTTIAFKNYSIYVCNIRLLDRIQSPSEFMISFAVRSESQSWFYHMYAFKITGGFWGMNKVSFIHSDRLDRTKPFATKNNTFVKELASAKCSVKYDKMYNYRIAFEGSDVALYIDGKKVLSAPFPDKSNEGRIAISARNVKIAVDKVEVKQGDKILFEDDFNEDSIYVRTLKVRRETATKEDETEKPE